MEIIYEYIYHLKEKGSFTKAAKHLDISQPALSMSIKKFEDEFSYQIFNRDTSPISLTPAGLILFKHIEKIKLLESNMQTQLIELDNATSGRIRIGATQYFTAFILPQIIDLFNEKYPQITFELIESNSTNLLNLLEENKIDLIFSVKSINPEKFISFKSFTDFLFIAIPKKLVENTSILDYSLTRDEILANNYEDLKSIPSLVSLKKTPFIVLRRGNNLYERSKMLFEMEGISPPIAMHIDQLTTAHYLSKKGMGATFTTSQLITQIDDENNLIYLKVDNELMIRDFRIILNKNKFISHIVDLFIDEFQQLPI